MTTLFRIRRFVPTLVWLLITSNTAHSFLSAPPQIPSNSGLVIKPCFVSRSSASSTHRKSILQFQWRMEKSTPCPLSSTRTSSTSSSSDEYAVDSQDEETLQTLFAKTSDTDGFMTKASVEQLKIIDDLLIDGDILAEEFDDIWKAAPKVSSSDDSVEKVNLDSFLQIYRDIDDLFEEEEDDDDSILTENKVTINGTAEVQDEEDKKALINVFETISDNDSKLLSMEGLKQWSEIQQLFDDGMFGEDEFDEIWNQTPKNTSDEQLDLEGFLSFNNALDELFVFEEDEEEEKVAEKSVVDKKQKSDEKEKELLMVNGEDLPPGVIFANLANENNLVAKKDLKRWVQLREMLNEGDLLPAEFTNFFDEAPKAEGTTDKLNEDGFTSLYEAIEALFEEVDDEEEATSPEVTVSSYSSKTDFMNLLTRTVATGSDTLPCGLECSDRQIEKMVAAASTLEMEASNLIVQRDGDITLEDLAGEWELIYSSSSTMKFNQGLSGIGGSFPNGKFAGLRQKLTFTKFLSDVEYLERIEVNPGSNSFDVKITGNWELKRSVSLFTGASTIAMRVEPDMVTYGPTKMKADHWKSLGPMNLLDITYLDDDIRIMRGTTATDTLIIFKRTA